MLLPWYHSTAVWVRHFHGRYDPAQNPSQGIYVAAISLYCWQGAGKVIIKECSKATELEIKVNSSMMGESFLFFSLFLGWSTFVTFLFQGFNKGVENQEELNKNSFIWLLLQILKKHGDKKSIDTSTVQRGCLQQMVSSLGGEVAVMATKGVGTLVYISPRNWRLSHCQCLV